MFNRFILVILICSIVLVASLAPNSSPSISAGNDTLQAAIQFDFNHIAAHSDPECPTATSGNGGGC